MIRRDDEESDGNVGLDGLIDPIDPNVSTGSSTTAAGGSGAGSNGVAFTLYLEFLGGLIPLLKVFFLPFFSPFFLSSLFLFYIQYSICFPFLARYLAQQALTLNHFMLLLFYGHRVNRHRGLGQSLSSMIPIGL